MGNQQPGGGMNPRQTEEERKRQRERRQEEQKRRMEAPPVRIGRKKKKGVENAIRLPQINPLTKCRLRLLRLDRVKDYLLMEEEFIKNQERLKPQDENKEKERLKVDEIRGTPM